MYVIHTTKPRKMKKTKREREAVKCRRQSLMPAVGDAVVDVCVRVTATTVQ